MRTWQVAPRKFCYRLTAFFAMAALTACGGGDGGGGGSTTPPASNPADSSKGRAL